MYPPILFITIALSASLLFLTGCKPPECQQMQECCTAVKDLPGVGPSCIGLAEGTDDAATCTTIVRTITYMLEDQNEAIPDACQD